MRRTGLLATLAVALVHSASADTITVCAEGCDFTSINAAIAAASDGDVIQLSAEVYQEGAQIDTLGKGITLRGAVDKNGEPTSVLDGQQSHGILICRNGETQATRFENLVVANGRAGGEFGSFWAAGLGIDNASPTIANCVFTNNVSVYSCSACLQGGAILIYNVHPAVARVIIDSCQFYGNQANNNGGAIFVRGAASITNCHFESNSSLWAGAVSIWVGDVEVTNCVFEANSATNSGGAINFLEPQDDGVAVPVIHQCVFRDNIAGTAGSAVFLWDESPGFATASVSGSTFCSSNGPPIEGYPWSNAGGNCFAVTCLDSDGDGTLDECDGSSPATLSVPSQYQTIQDAIVAASTGDVIEIDAGTYVVDSTIDTLGKVITLRGATDESGDPATTLDGQSSIRVLLTRNGEPNETLFENLVIRNGYADRGGGMANIGTSPTIVNCVFESNVASERGGGMYNLYGSPIVASSRFDLNAANWGGGAYNQSGSQAEYRHCVFKDNVASRAGGAIRNMKASPLVIESMFEKNASEWRGGGIASTVFDGAGELSPGDSLAIPTIEQCAFVGNVAAQMGGAIYSEVASFVVRGCVFEENTARSGGAIRADNPNWGGHPPREIHECSFRFNMASDGRGGAIYTSGGIQVEDTEFSDNSAVLWGGAIFMYGPDCVLSGCLFDNNYAPVGSAVHNLATLGPEALAMSDCEFTSCCEVTPPWSFTDGGGNDYQAWCDDCRADVNCLDDAVDAADLAYMLGVWGTSDPQCDITGDGIVDGADLGALLIGWGPCR